MSEDTSHNGSRCKIRNWIADHSALLSCPPRTNKRPRRMTGSRMRRGRDYPLITSIPFIYRGFKAIRQHVHPKNIHDWPKRIWKVLHCCMQFRECVYAYRSSPPAALNSVRRLFAVFDFGLVLMSPQNLPRICLRGSDVIQVDHI